jgi:hypothetical protein
VKSFIGSTLRKYENPIIYIKEIDKILSSDSVPEYLEKSLFNGRVSVIASLSEKSFSNISKDKLGNYLKRFFNPMQVNEC